MILQQHNELGTAQAADVWKPPTHWSNWVSSIPIKSGSGISTFNPLPWQQSVADCIIINRNSRKIYTFCKSRQIGATTLVLSIIDFLCLTIPGFRALLLHKTFLDALELGNRNRKFLTAANVPMLSDSQSRQEFPNGSVAYFRSSDPESCGRGLDSVDAVIYEECGFYSDLPATIGAIAPAQSWCGNAISLFVSTPNGKRGEGAKYWELVSNGDDRATTDKLSAIRNCTEQPFQILRADSPSTLFLVHWRAIDRYAKEPDFKARIIEESGISEQLFNQEYDLDFSQAETESVFPFALVDAATSGEFEKPDLDEIYYLGIDAATSGADYVVAIVIKKKGSKLSVVKLYRRQKGTSEQHLAAIADIIRTYEPIQTLVEKNGAGQIWLEQLSALNLPTQIEGFFTSRESKEGLVGRLVVALEREDLSIPQSQITQELLSFQRSSNGRLEAASKEHDDCVVGLALGLLASQYGVLE